MSLSLNFKILLSRALRSAIMKSEIRKIIIDNSSTACRFRIITKILFAFRLLFYI